MKKKISFALVLAMLLSTLACGNGSQGENPSTTTPADTTEPVEENSREAISDDLPERDFDGRAFRIYSAPTFTPLLYVGEQTGDIVDDAVWKANQTVQDRFNMVFESIYYSDEASALNEPVKLILAQDDVYDIAEMHDITAANASLDGNFINLYDIPHLDFSKPWWSEKAVESLTYHEQMYLCANSISYRALTYMFCIFVNKDLITKYNMEVPYEDVFDGTWTYDKLISMSKDIYEDTNGNSQRDNEDVYGFAHWNYFRCTLESSGISVVEKDENGDLFLNVNQENTYTLLDKWYTLLFENEGGFFTKNSTDLPKFEEGHLMFVYARVGEAADTYRFGDTNYTLLPVPKLTEDQDYYAGYCARPIVVPVTCPDTEFVGIIMEAMSAEGYKKVFPAYYEVAMKVKYTDDSEAAQVLDILYDNSVLDFAYMYMPTFSNTLATLLGADTPSTNFASYYEKNEKAQQTRLNTVIKAFEKMAEE